MIYATTATTDKLAFTPITDTDTIDDLGDGSTYGRVRQSSLDAGQVLLTAVIGDLDDVSDGATYERVQGAALSAGVPLLAQAQGDIDDVDDGSTYSKVKATSVQAGEIVLSAVVGDLDDIADGTYSKVLATSVQAGKIILSEADGDIDDLDDGTTYGKVKNTILAAGFIQVGTGTKDSTLDGFHIDNNEIVGQLNGVDQILFNTSGQLVAGDGDVTLDRFGITFGTGSFASLDWDGSDISIDGLNDTFQVNLGRLGGGAATITATTTSFKHAGNDIPGIFAVATGSYSPTLTRRFSVLLDGTQYYIYGEPI